MQPPPRKAKITTVLRNVHNEHITKLQNKHQQDIDFLEDIRNFTKIKASIDKNYAEGLLKLSSQFLQKKIPSYPDIKSQEDENKTVYAVWRTVLDETERVAKARLAAVEVYQQTISEGAKTVRNNKLQVAKKCFENLRRMHDEMQQCVLEVEKTRKLYFEEEHMAHEAREKACDAEEKLKKKKGRIFQSVSSLKRTSAKFSSRKEACDIQATKARNDYILAVVAANAHLGRYQEVDLPELMQTLDCDIYEKVREYIQLMSRTELLTCAACHSSYTTVEQQAEQITRDYTVSCFLQDTPVISQSVQYAFEPCDNDPITTISTEHNAALCLSKEARKWASCIAKETRTLRDATKELHRLQGFLASGQKSCEPGPSDPPGGPIDVESKLDEVKNTVRRAETSKLKAEARIEALREGGVNVDEWLKNLDNDSLTPYDLAPEALSRSGSTTSRTSRVSRASSRKSTRSEQQPVEEPSASEADEAFYDSDFNDESDVSGSPQLTSATPDTPSRKYEDTQLEVDAVAAATSAWDDMPAEESEPPVEGLDGYGAEDYSAADYGTTPDANVDYTAEYTAEYTVETEVTTIEETRAEPLPGIRCVALYSYEATNPDELSFVEQEELEIIGEGDGDGWVRARNYRGDEGYIPQTYVEVIDAQPTSSSSHPPLTSFSSVDYTVGPEENALDAGVAVEGIAEEAENVTALTFAPPVGSTEAVWCRALYDYEATGEDELSFLEGQLIRILRKVIHDDVDDGWWEGEIDGVTGIFPSLVVEELKSTGEPQTPEEATTPSDSAPPPAFTPPEPQFMVPPTQVILTQPTPEVSPGEEVGEKQDGLDEGNYVPLVSSPELSPNHEAAQDNAEQATSEEKEKVEDSGAVSSDQSAETSQGQQGDAEAMNRPIPEISISEPTEPPRHASDTEEEDEAEDQKQEDESQKSAATESTKADSVEDSGVEDAGGKEADAKEEAADETTDQGSGPTTEEDAKGETKAEPGETSDAGDQGGKTKEPVPVETKIPDMTSVKKDSEESEEIDLK